MRHCCQFKANDIYCLAENDLYTTRTLSIGFCPICKKPVAELLEWRFDGKVFKQTLVGVEANTVVLSLADEILYSLKEINNKKTKSKPYGWVYGINKQLKNGKARQYACDFYGNKELIKTV